MAQKKRLNRFQNVFEEGELPQEIAVPDKDKIILSENVGDVIQQKFQALLNLYQQTTFDNGYNPAFSYRILMLYLHSEVRNRSYNYFEEVNRFIKYALDSKDFGNIKKSMDLLILKPLVYKVPDRQIKLWKILVLKGVRKHYKKNKLNKQKRKVSKTIKSLCIQTLKKQEVKKDVQMYSQLLNYYLEEQQHSLKFFIKQKKHLPAIQCCNNIIRTLEKIQSQILPKYQKQLMKAYWDNAQLHYHLHYITYAKKYTQIALNIASRIGQQQLIEDMRKLIDQVTI